MLKEIQNLIENKNNYKNIYECYEECKKVLTEEVLSPGEHLEQIKEITKALNI